MNSEELELSLRTEFEEQLKNVLVGMRQEVAQLQEKVEAEFEKHKSQLSEVFKDFSARIETEKELDAGFSEAVVEHLRLARDEGARITATAIAEAEDMQRASTEAEEPKADPKVAFANVRDAINDISSQTSQASILKTLVSQAAKFTTRGAFFILKNEHFVGWRVFGSSQEETDDQAIREIFFPVSAETVLGESVRSLSAVESSNGTYSGDSVYLDKLEFGHPERMFAIPLIARGRGVAVLYADSGEENAEVNLEALETLVRVAGLTVEVTAAQGSTPPSRHYSEPASVQPQREVNRFEAKTNYQSTSEPDTESVSESYQPETQAADSQTASGYNSSFSEKTVEPAVETNYQSSGDSFSFQPSYQPETTGQNVDSSYDFKAKEPDTHKFQTVQSEEQEAQSSYEPPEPVDQNYNWSANQNDYSVKSEEADDFSRSKFSPAQTEDFSVSPETNYQTETNAYGSGQSLESSHVQFEETAEFDNSQFESPQFEAIETPQYEPLETFVPPAEEVSFPKEENFSSFKTDNFNASDFAAKPVETPIQPVAASPVKSRFSDRNVDLPIEVTEDERRLHNDARRFARLLVSEIKLYNEQKVKEGREANDLYERLREAIDRSREMYDKRVQPPVAAKFDYFHYELVNSLAEGEQAKLGKSYSGANI